ncbi:MAG: Hsp70 protein that interacts with Zuo1p [Vezdaea aestivalis]|nr:MAG: Hsp70 protein that interacts with Zuo1p [Vezdaea aestivalis]
MTAAEGSDSSVGTLEARNAIGISFGNSYSSIAYTSGEGKAEVIANEEGGTPDRQIPSTLSYVDGEEYHGTQAKSHLVRNASNTVTYFRDFLGKDFKSIDPTHCHTSAHPIESGSDTTSSIQEHVAFSIREGTDESTTEVPISTITTRHLNRLASSASGFIGKEVNAAVITVPTDFSDRQKEALRRAATAAGIDILQFINEPVASILAYDARQTSKIEDKIIIVADLGGTRSDVAIVASRGGMYSILATNHDYNLGGIQLDQVLIDHFSKEFLKKHKSDPRQNARSLAKLKLEAEATKKSLSLGNSATLSVESLAEGIDFSSTINRSRFELLANKVFSGFTRLIEAVVQKAGLDILDVDEIILSGGTSHTPKIARNLQSVFPATTTILAPSTSPTAINPSELAARGAAIQASLIQEFEHEDIEQSTHPMVTATPHLAKAIGVTVVEPASPSPTFYPILFAETAVPARRTVIIPAAKEGGDLLVKLCEGIRDIKVTKVETSLKKDQGSDEDDDSDIDSEEEEEETREKEWKVGAELAELAVKGVKKGGKVEVMANVAVDLSIQVTAREVGAKGGVRGQIKGRGAENGSA